MKYVEALTTAKQRLEAAGIMNPALDAEYLLEFLTGMNHAQYFMHMNDSMDQETADRFDQLIDKRSKHIPLQHLTGHQEFMGLDFKVSPAVLVPRQDTEILVEETLKVVEPGNRVLDVCTGSGCIIISIMKLAANKQLSCTGVDISKEALLIASENARTNETEVEFVESNLFENISGKYDIIVSNPPYIRTDDIAGLMEEVRDHDPYIALDGGSDGLDFYRLITAGAVEHLSSGGRLHYEVGVDQSEAVSNIMTEYGFTNIRIAKDYSDNNRVVMGEYYV